MCGRFTLTSTPESLAERFDLEEPPECSPRYNIAPGQEVLAVRENGARAAQLLLWGLVPRWSDGPGAGARPINARVETVASKPTFREAYRERRCIVPADGFYEWADRAGVRQPYWIGPVEGGPFAIAGLWERWTSPEGESLESCTLLTTAAREPVTELHGRAPLILDPARYDAWLDSAAAESVLDDLLATAPPALAFHPVSPRVNRVGVDDPRCLEPVPEPPRQPSLF